MVVVGSPLGGETGPGDSRHRVTVPIIAVTSVHWLCLWTQRRVEWAGT